MAVTTADESIFKTLQVSNLAEKMPNVINYFTLKTASFKAGQLSHRLCEWRKITSDVEVLRKVAGEKIEFISPPYQTCFKTKHFSAQENSVIAQEIQHLLAKEVIVESVSEQGEITDKIDQSDQSLLCSLYWQFNVR